MLQVQTVGWSRHSPELLLSGSFDKSVALVLSLSLGSKDNLYKTIDCVLNLS